MKCKVIDCRKEAISEEESQRRFGAIKYKGYCLIHANERYRVDEQLKQEELEELEKLKEEENGKSK